MTPTSSGRPVRAAYEACEAVKWKAATSASLLRQPLIWKACHGANT